MTIIPGTSRLRICRPLRNWYTGYWGGPTFFSITVGDIQELPKVLEGAASFESQPADEEMVRLVGEEGLEPVFI